MVGEVRGVGMIGAIELVTDKDRKTALDSPGKLGVMGSAAAQRNGMISRAIGDALTFCPPLIVGKEDIDFMIEAARKSLDDVYASL